MNITNDETELNREFNEFIDDIYNKDPNKFDYEYDEHEFGMSSRHNKVTKSDGDHVTQEEA